MVWSELFPAEQARIVQLLVERVDVQEDVIEVRIRAEGLVSLIGALATLDPAVHRGAAQPSRRARSACRPLSPAAGCGWAGATSTRGSVPSVGVGQGARQ